MPISASTLELLMNFGIEGENLLAVVRAVESDFAKPRSSGAERQARYMARKRQTDVINDTSLVTDISPTPPIDITTTQQGLEISPPTPSTPKNSRLHGTNPRALGTNPRGSEQEPDGFTDFWAAYPKRDGNMDRKGAVKAFGPAVQRAGGHELVTRAAARYAAHCREKGKIGTEFVKQARSWLNGDLWKEWLPQEPIRAAVSRVMVREGSPAWDAWKRTGRRFTAMDLKDDHGHVIGRGWYFETEFPPEVQAA